MPNLPALTVGLLLTAYWARVVRLVLKIRRTTGRPANFAPREPLGMRLAIWYPAVLAWIVHPLLSAFPESISLPVIAQPRFTSPVASWIATAVALAAFVATLVCWKKMGKSWRMGINPGEKTQLIVSGPYAYVRHPIYALSSLLMLATVVIVPSWLMLAVAAVHLLLLQWEARREEQYLLQAHGSVYGDYCRQVGRFVPRSLRAFGG